MMPFSRNSFRGRAIIAPLWVLAKASRVSRFATRRWNRPALARGPAVALLLRVVLTLLTLALAVKIGW